MAILNLFSRSPWRITLIKDATPTVTLADYVITRKDSAPTTIVVNYAFLVGPNAVELSLSEAMLLGVIYTLTLPNDGGAPSALIAYSQPAVLSPIPGVGTEDPEAETYGIDIDWLADATVGNGDTPTVRGRACVMNDLASLALISPGEIFHRPGVGAGLKLRVNAPGQTAELNSAMAALKREWSRDPRVRQNGVSIKGSLSSSGTTTIVGTVQTIALDEPLIIKVPGGGS